MDFEDKGVARVSVWALCHTPDDCEQMIAWLRLAQNNLRQWEKISPKPKPAPSKATEK